jgi:hypothetical protein
MIGYGPDYSFHVGDSADLLPVTVCPVKAKRRSPIVNHQG